MRSSDTAFFALLLALAACNPRNREMSRADSQAVRADIERTIRDAYDLSKPNVAERMLSLYPPTGPIVSAAGGRVVGSRDSLAAGIRYFWNNVGVNMRNPQWVWEKFYVDVLSPTTAVLTATYRIPHRDPYNNPHELAGAMTEVFEKRGGKWVIVQEHLSDLPASDSAATTMSHEHH
jgi:ketosteroid isomerase-like protein